MSSNSSSPARGDAGEVFLAFLRLGLTSFGGPVAHLGYFREAFVVRRGWLSEDDFAAIVALCQLLPGPASSQTGFAIGHVHAGWPGALAAFAGFTLPSALAMTLLGLGAHRLEGPWAEGMIHGLKLVAVAVVAQAVIGMARTLTPDLRRAGIAIVGAATVLLAGALVGQLAAIGAGLALGAILCRLPGETPAAWPSLPRISRRAGVAALSLFAAGLVLAPLLAAASGWPPVRLFDAIYRSGALVFGGGHVVLPLLREALVVPGLVGEDRFLAGYGAAQALPGPLFTFAAFLGADLGGPRGALLATLAVFLPGFLLLTSALPFWIGLARHPAARAAIAGANAAVVGVLAAALYDPVWTSAVASPIDALAAAAGLALLVLLRWPPVAVVALGAACGLVRAGLS